ncbi:ATP--guanido phosphotransferase [Caproiciproducens sp. NJN-50]|uniref:ATP--guanido phosphotransferase n=1 Tax=Acutalibacteraceae TaxID=3082771 RepID=UPI000FFE136E|nr:MULTISPECIES: ATP--guanido phosphotransferase [Acutalibacteraceae]QAT49824.1 ATP--guanido phosphotransferase [Caproiciproducens sp. NJN-50]
MKKWYETTEKDADVSTGTFVNLARNLTGVPFPSRMSMSDRRFVLEKIRTALRKDQDSEYAHFAEIDLESASEAQAVALAENGLISAEMATDRHGRGLMVSKDESLSVAVNGEDHLLIQSRAAGIRLKKAYFSADELDTYLDRLLSFAFDSQLGYLSQNPFYLGTGMIATLRLHLPALMESGSTGRIANNLSKLGLTLRGAYGPGPNPRGAFFHLSNQVTMGLSEQEALTNLFSMAGQLIAREHEIRDALICQLSVQDTILRDLGILQKARLLSFDEFLRRASSVRLGISAGLIGGIDVCEMDTMICKAQPATLVFENGEALTEEERQKLRARMIREGLKQGTEDFNAKR